MYKEKIYRDEKERKVIDLSLGFKETIELRGKATTEMQMFYSDFIVKIAKPILKALVERFGRNYSFSWYFIDESPRIKYFENNEWKIDSVYNLLEESEINEI